MRARGLKQLAPWDRQYGRVAPRAGAWIETAVKNIIMPAFIVAPRAGAWIETHQSISDVLNALSRPVRARGLKHLNEMPLELLRRSRPVRARGLKHGKKQSVLLSMVAPRAGAWIETLIGLPAELYVRSRVSVAPRAGAWIETASMRTGVCFPRRAPCGHVD